MIVHHKKFSVNFKLKPGDIFCFNNRRVLHGRKEYDPNSGHRHLQGYYLDMPMLFVISISNFLTSVSCIKVQKYILKATYNLEHMF